MTAHYPDPFLDHQDGTMPHDHADAIDAADREHDDLRADADQARKTAKEDG